MADKKITLHPKNENGQLVQDTNLYPKTTIDQVYSSDGSTPYGDDSFQKPMSAGEGIRLENNSINIDYESITFKNVLLNTLYPVGAIYVSYELGTNGKCPIEVTLGGSWERIKHQFLFGAGDSTDTRGTSGGSKDAVVVAHTHTINPDGAHSHTTNSTNKELKGTLGPTMYYNPWSGRSNGICTISKATNDWGSGSNSDGQGQWTIDATHSHGTDTQGSHSHSMENPAGSVSGTGMNMPPYICVYIWKRTA